MPKFDYNYTFHVEKYHYRFMEFMYSKFGIERVDERIDYYFDRLWTLLEHDYLFEFVGWCTKEHVDDSDIVKLIERINDEYRLIDELWKKRKNN